jgi:hypothetical protein
MKRILLLLILFPILFHAQNKPLKKSEEAALYTKGIQEYIKAAQKKNNMVFDTLFAGRYEDIHAIKFPKKIGATPFVVINNEEGGEKLLKRRSQFYYINVVPAVFAKDRAEFMFVHFLVVKENGVTKWYPQHNCHVDLKYNSKTKQYELDKASFEDYAGAKKP